MTSRLYKIAGQPLFIFPNQKFKKTKYLVFVLILFLRINFQRQKSTIININFINKIRNCDTGYYLK